ncbi:MAG TPA: MBL fold metallo-hydrolase [Candidatus Acidoferrales bacterium]
MNSSLVAKRAATRREILKMGSGFAGAAAVSAMLPISAGAAAGWWQQSQQQASPVQAPISNDRVAQMRAQAATVPVNTTKLRDNIYMLSGPGGNMIALTGPEGKVLVDSSFAGAVPHISAALAAIDARPLKLLINTHWHFDHTDGNALLHDSGATIIAHENTLKRLSTPQEIKVFQMHFDAAEPAAWPRRTFTDQFTLYYNGEQISLGHILPAHTDSDIYVRYEKGNVLHCGDVWFNGIYPFIDPSSGGNIDGMIAGSAECLKHADAETVIIPGHGPLGNRAQLQSYHDMMITVRDRVQKQKAAGKTVAEVVAAKPTADLDAEWGKGNVTGDFFATLVYTTL